MNCRVLVSNQDNCGVYSDRCWLQVNI
jgi:hypothetical protein